MVGNTNNTTPAATSGPRKKHGWLWNLLGILGFAAVSAAVVGGWMLLHKGHSEAANGKGRVQAPVVVTVEPATTRPLQRTVHVVGTLHGRDEIAISAKVQGPVVKVHHDVGDAVRSGEPLLEIDPTNFVLAVAEAKRGLELTLARLGVKEMPDKGMDVTVLPAVAKATAQERNAFSRLERMRRLAGTVTAEERDQSEAEYKVALANQRLAVLEAEAIIAEARQRQAALDTAQQRLKDTLVLVPGSLERPTDYLVSHREVAVGDTAHPAPGNGVVFRLVIDRPLKLKVTVPERHWGEVQAGQVTELEVEAYRGQQFAGHVARVSPTIDRASRTFSVEIHVPNDDRKLSPGSFAKVAILTKTGDRARTVPEEAVVRFAGVTKLFVVKGDKAREVQVRTGQAVDVIELGRKRTWVEVIGDLPDDASVVTSGQTQLADGTPVQVREGGAGR